jgi:PKD repeat protein
MPAQRPTLSRLLLACLIALAAILPGLGQTLPAQADTTPRIEVRNLDGIHDDWFTFQRIHQETSFDKMPWRRFNTMRIVNSGSAPLNVSSLTVSGPDSDSFFVVRASDRGPFSILAGGQRDVLLEMQGGATDERRALQGERYATLTISSDDPSNPQLEISLAGYNMPKQQGAFEPLLQSLFNIFGYSMRMVNPNTGNYERLRFTQDPDPNDGIEECSSFVFADQDLVGDEITSNYWAKGNTSQPVTIRQLAALHKRDFEEGAWLRGSGYNTNNAISITHDIDQYQALLPYNRLFRGNNTINDDIRVPTYTLDFPAYLEITATLPVSFEIIGANRTSARPAMNPPRSRALVFYPLRDRAGKLIPNTYIYGQDYVGSCETNFDFQDNVWLITNVRPVSVTNDPNLGRPLPGAESLVLPFTQEVPGTLLDVNNKGTGFKTVQRNKWDFGFPDRPPTNTHVPSLLNLDTSGTGSLQITSSGSNDGAFTETSGGDLRNGLCLPFDGRFGRYTVSTRLLGPFTSLTPSIRMTGLMFGPSHHDFVRLTVGSQISTATQGRPWIQFAYELSNTLLFSSTLVSLPALAPGGNLAQINSLDLELTGDATSGAVTAAYRVNGGARVELPEKLILSGPGFYRLFAPQAMGCIYASNRFTSAYSMRFDHLSITPADDPLQPVIARYNVGGPTLTTDDGVTWQSDQGLFSPSAPNEPGAQYAQPADIAGTTTRDAIYRSYRGNVGNVPIPQREITWSIPVGDAQTVDLRLHFAELFWGRSEPNNPPFGSDPDRVRRVFDVFVEDRKVMDEFNITRAADGVATATVVPIENIAVTDGVLNIRLKAEADHPALSAIEIFEQPNVAPVANAGLDQSVPIGQPVTLQGDGSDANNDPLTFAWQQTGGPSVSLVCGPPATCVFTPTSSAAFTFTLTVSDPGGLSDSDSVTIFATNQPPLAVPGNDQVVRVGTLVTLDGSASSDPEGGALSYGWTQSGGPSVSLTCGGSNCSFTPMTTGELTFTLRVTDTGGLSDANSVVVSVINGTPSVEAGPNQTVDVSQLVTLSATGSDPDGDPFSYLWTQTGGSPVTLSGASSASPSFAAPPTPGSLTFQVRTRDSFGLESQPATTTVTVRDIAPAGLFVNSSGSALGQPTFFTATLTAGTNVSYLWDFGGGQTASGPTTSRTFPAAGIYTVTVTASNGSGSLSTQRQVTISSLAPTASSSSPTRLGQSTQFTATAVGQNLTYLWNFGDGTLGTGANASHAYTTAGIYTATLIVQGNGEEARVTTIVYVVSAGQDQTVAPGSSVTLGAPLGGTTGGLSFLWEQVSGPSVTLQGANSPQPSFTAPEEPARLTFRLTVTGPDGQQTVDTVEVIVGDGGLSSTEIYLPLISGGL